jgi:hypothetical protein
VKIALKRYQLDIEASDVNVSVGVLGRFRVWLSLSPELARRVAAALIKAAERAEENAR